MRDQPYMPPQPGEPDYVMRFPWFAVLLGLGFWILLAIAIGLLVWWIHR